MTTCQELKNRILDSSSPDLGKLPADLEEHVAGCPSCRQDLESMRDYVRDARTPELTSREKEEMLTAILDSVRTGGSPASSGDLLTRLANLFAGSLRPAFAALAVLCLGVFLAVSFSRGKAPARAAVEIFLTGVQGRGTLTPPEGKALALDERWIAAEPGSLLEWGEPGSATIRFPSSGLVQVQGHGRLVLAPDGFRPDSAHGRFTFTRTGVPFRIALPVGSVMVTGTILELDLNAGVGTIRVTEGEVRFRPLDPGKPEAILKTGQILVVTSGTASSSPVASGVMPLPMATDSAGPGSGTDSEDRRGAGS